MSDQVGSDQYTIGSIQHAGGVAVGTGSSVNVHLPRPFTPGSAPPVPTLVVGRDTDLRALKERLRVRDQGPVQILTAMRGWPGVGKTTLAAMLAHDPELHATFPDGVLWTSLGPAPTLLAKLAEWGRALGADDLIQAQSIEEAAGRLRALLMHKRMLLIVDDAWQSEHVEAMRVGGAHCVCLVTTRRRDVASAIAPDTAIYKLNVLSDADALVLLRELTPDVVAAHPAACEALVRELEGLPLALQVAGRLLRSQVGYGFRVERLIADLRAGARLLEAKAPPDRGELANETTPTVAALLQKSTDLLDEQTRECFACLGPFAPKPATFDLAAMAAIWDVGDPEPVVSTLVDRGLLEYVQELNRYQLHALLVLHANALLED